MEPRHIEKLKEVYRNVDDIDLYVGGFLEAAHEDSILGPVFKCIIGDQFARLVVSKCHDRERSPNLISG